MINREHDLPITKQAEVLRISRGSVYYLLPAAPGAGRRCCGNPHGSLTQADAPLIERGKSVQNNRAHLISFSN